MLAEQFTVIAPDLPGIRDSAIPRGGLGMKTAAIRIHALARSLGVNKAEVVGHDIGLMVAYAYAAQFPAETEKLVVMDAFLRSVAEWEDVYNNPGVWHFRFNGPTPEAAYARPGHMRAGWAYFVSFQQAARDFAQLSQSRLPMPVLAIGGEKANGALLGQQMKIVASDATMVVLKEHWTLGARRKSKTDD